MTEPANRATSFGSAVQAYQQGRPDYVAEHVAWLLDQVHGPVIDLAAGSGKLTRAVAGLGYAVTAVDPDAKMLAAITDHPTLTGTAEHIPLPQASAAAVTVGQAWHWFDPQAAAAEIARVLRPGGRLGLIWSTRDRSHPFVAELSELMGESPGERMMDVEGVADLPGFTPFDRHRWERVRLMNADQLEAMVISRSYFLTAEATLQAEIVDGVRRLLATHAHTRGRDQFEYPLHSTAYRADRCDSSR